jgi:hypothetical protein
VSYDDLLRWRVSVTPVPQDLVPAWPASDAIVRKTCRGGSKATVEICESDSVGNYAKKYVHPDLKSNNAEWQLEQGRLQNDLKTYQSLEKIGLGDSFGRLHHHSQTEDEGLVLYLEYAGSDVLANYVMSDSPECLETMVAFFEKITQSVTDICVEAGMSGEAARSRCKDLFFDRIVNRLKPSVDVLAPLFPNPMLFLDKVTELRERWEALYTRLEPVLLSGNVAPLPTDTTFLNMMLNPDTGVVKCIDPGKIDSTAPAYPLGKMLVFGPYYRFVNDKEFGLQAGFVPTKPEDVAHTHRVLAASQKILETMDTLTASQTIVAGLIQFGGDLGYRYNVEDSASGKTAADLSLFERALNHLESVVGDAFQAMGLPRDMSVSEETKCQFSDAFVGCRSRSLSKEVALMLPVKEK